MPAPEAAAGGGGGAAAEGGKGGQGSARFGDSKPVTAEFVSCWEDQRTTCEAGMQTTVIATSESGAQARESADAEVQTEPEPEPDVWFRSDDSPELAAFLDRVVDNVCAQLEQNHLSHAFDGYQVTWEDDAGAIRRLYSLTDTQQRPDAPCAALSWSCNGSTLVAGYGRMDHENWCTHKGLVCTWNINRRTLDTHKADLALELPGCVQSLDCHPASNSVFAVGTFNGGVFVADASQPDGQEVVASSGIGQGGHTEPVTQVRWLAGLDARRRRQHFRLVSVAGDGKVLIWAAVRNSATLALLQILPVTAASIPRSLRQGKPSPATATAELGLTCLSFSHENRDLFLLGTEGGSVLKCVLPPGAGADTPPSTVETDAAAAAAAPPPPPLPSPVQFAYTGHRGPVYGLACSPYHRNLFLTASTDMSLSIAHMLERQPAVVLEPGLGYLFDIQWSPVRPLVFAAAGANGLVLLYDLMASQTGPAAILNVAGAKATAADGSGSKAAGGAGGGGSGEAAAAAGLPVVDSGSHRKGEHPVYTLAFNRQRGGLLATGDATGAVHIFNLGQQFSIQDPREPGLLDELAGLA